jgi:hypothetical protein
MISTAFDPAKHGFHFRNGTFNTHVGPFACGVLCGGMAYAALDYIYTGIKPPDLKKAPTEGNPLETYLYRRQETAHFYTWHKFTAAWSTNIPIIGGALGMAGVGQSDYADLQNWLGKKYPVVVCLFDGISEGHHVVAIGCDPGKKQIQLYDSNHPDQRSNLTEKNGRWLHSISGRNWKGWFIDWGWYTEGVRQPPVPWRYCPNCRCLHTTAFGSSGNCPGGGTHAANPNFEYFLNWNMDKGQRQWKVCKKCQGAVCLVDPQQGKSCPAGGTHDPRGIEFAVTMGSGAGEGDWKSCFKCASLYWAGNNMHGKCAKGGAHDPKYSAKYFLDYRTV